MLNSVLIFVISFMLTSIVDDVIIKLLGNVFCFLILNIFLVYLFEENSEDVDDDIL